MSESEIITDCIGRGWTVTIDAAFAEIEVHDLDGLSPSRKYLEWGVHPNALLKAYRAACEKERR